MGGAAAVQQIVVEVCRLGTVGASPRVQPGPGYFLSTDTVVYQLPLGIVCPAFVYQIKFLRRPEELKMNPSIFYRLRIRQYIYSFVTVYLCRPAELLCPSAHFQ